MALINNKKGTGFTNIADILGANKGFGGRLGAAVGTGIGNVAGNAAQAANTGIQKFQTGLTTSRDAAGNIINEVKGFAGDTELKTKQPGETDQQYADRLASYTNRVGTSTTDFDALGKKFGEVGYTGPKDVEGLSNIRSQIQNAQGLGSMAKDTSGQNQLLGSYVANRNRGYNMGQSGLDQLLLGKSQEGQKALQSGIAKTGQLGKFNNLLGSAKTQASNIASGIEQDKATTRASLVNSLSGTGDEASGRIKGIMTQAGDQANQFNTDVTRLQSIITDLSSGKMPKDFTEKDQQLINNLKDYGFNDQGENLANLYVSKNQNNFNRLLSNLGTVGSNLVAQSGGDYYKTPEQKQAALNLATMLQDSTAKSNIEQSVRDFTTDRFDEQNLAGLANRDVEFDRNQVNQAIANAQNERNALYNTMFKHRIRGEDVGDVIRPERGFGGYKTALDVANRFNTASDLLKNYGINVGGTARNAGSWGEKLELGGMRDFPSSINQYRSGIQSGSQLGQQQSLQNILQNMLANQGNYNRNWTPGGTA